MWPRCMQRGPGGRMRPPAGGVHARPRSSELTTSCRFPRAPFVLGATIPTRRLQMKYMLLIHQGDAPTPLDPDAWNRLPEEERNAVYADYRALNETPGVTPGLGLADPASAT